MDKKQRVESAIKGKQVDIIPWTMYFGVPPQSRAELDFRTSGLSIVYASPVCKNLVNNVEVKEEISYIFRKNDGTQIFDRTFITPYGEIFCKYQFKINNEIPEPGQYFAINKSSLDISVLSWVKEYPFKKESDYKLLKYFYENTNFVPLNDDYNRTVKIVGSEGITMLNVGFSPFQALLFQLMGVERTVFEYYDNNKKFISLYELLYEKYREKYLLAAESPALAIWAPENITASIVSPKLFKEFHLPFYKEMAEILHRKGKIYIAHFDGLVLPLAKLIAKSDLDVIEAFTPFPMGDMTISEARDAWKDKVIWMNFPGTIISKNDEIDTREFTLDLLKSIAPGDRFLIGCTEIFPMDNWPGIFNQVCRILNQYGKYPIKPNNIPD